MGCLLAGAPWSAPAAGRHASPGRASLAHLSSSTMAAARLDPERVPSMHTINETRSDSDGARGPVTCRLAAAAATAGGGGGGSAPAAARVPMSVMQSAHPSLAVICATSRRELHAGRPTCSCRGKANARAVVCRADAQSREDAHATIEPAPDACVRRPPAAAAAAAMPARQCRRQPRGESALYLQAPAECARIGLDMYVCMCQAWTKRHAKNGEGSVLIPRVGVWVAAAAGGRRRAASRQAGLSGAAASPGTAPPASRAGG